ncbi:Exocyst complex component SEC3A [Camellia lanceoleosa]|uniref:Exocyst complex component SEC3A n=1 Tax=Camellia lanceoleosa TaxID=1840588 RepID=A0ACC0I718_9ERIC|nr:Exocyst complex component SEC3A [Camellia lanceoleosa]
MGIPLSARDAGQTSMMKFAFDCFTYRGSRFRIYAAAPSPFLTPIYNDSDVKPKPRKRLIKKNTTAEESTPDFGIGEEDDGEELGDFVRGESDYDDFGDGKRKKFEKDDLGLLLNGVSRICEGVRASERRLPLHVLAIAMPLIPFQLGLSKLDLRKVVKSSLFGVDKSITAMYKKLQKNLTSEELLLSLWDKCKVSKLFCECMFTLL